MTHTNSIKAYHTLNDLGKRQRDVYEVIHSKGLICNVDIAYELRLPINSITGRTNELVKLGLIEEGKRSKGPTGRIVTFWRLKKENNIDWEKMRLEAIKKRDEIAEQPINNFGQMSII